MRTSNAETHWAGFAIVTAVCAKRAGAATSVECRRREPVRGDLAGVTHARQRQSLDLSVHAHSTIAYVILLYVITVAHV